MFVSGAGVKELDTLVEVVDALAGMDLDTVDDAALGGLIAGLHRQAQRVEAVRLRCVAAHDRRMVWQAEGARSAKEWLSGRCGLTRGEAAGQVEVARGLACLPQTAARLAAGQMSLSQARTATTVARQVGADAHPDLDDVVAGTADAGGDSAAIRSAVDGWAHRHDQRLLVERRERSHRRRRLTLTRLGDGSVGVDGRVDPVGGEILLTAVGALSAPSGEGDARTPEQRRADALVELARRDLDRGDLPMVGGERPHVTVVVHADTLTPAPASQAAAVAPKKDTRGVDGPRQRKGTAAVHDIGAADGNAAADGNGAADGNATADGSGAADGNATADGSGAADGGTIGDRGGATRQPGAPPALLDHTGAVAAETARMLACDAAVTRVVMNGASQVLDTGRATRTVSPAQRRALIARDQGCRGCGAPPAWTQAHHITHWAHGGPTDLTNLVLLCWTCHDNTHHRGWTLTRGPDTRWQLTPPPRSHAGARGP